MADLYARLFGRVLRVRFDGDRAHLELFDVDAGGWLALGSGGAGGSPLLRPGGLQHAVELVVFPGDPPDPVVFRGDFVYIRRMQPDFTLSPSGDVTMLEGR